MSGVGIIVGKKACCCLPAGCNQLDLRSWLAPAGKYQQLAVACGISGNWYRTPITQGCGASWSANITAADTDRDAFNDVYGFPRWFSPSNQTIGGGSHPSMYGVLSASIGVVGWNATGAAQLPSGVPACVSGSSGPMGFVLTVQVAYYSNDPDEACYPFITPGYSDTQGFSVSYAKRCCNFQDGPLGTYYRVGAQTITSGPNQTNAGSSTPQYEVFFTRTAADTLTVTEEL